MLSASAREAPALKAGASSLTTSGEMKRTSATAGPRRSVTALGLGCAVGLDHPPLCILQDKPARTSATRRGLAGSTESTEVSSRSTEVEKNRYCLSFSSVSRRGARKIANPPIIATPRKHINAVDMGAPLLEYETVLNRSSDAARNTPD